MLCGGICLVLTLHVAKQHAQSVAKHLGVESGLIYLVGRPSLLYEDSDQPPPFRQRRYFSYLSGANFEDAIVTYDIKRDNLRLFIPPINPKTVIVSMHFRGIYSNPS